MSRFNSLLVNANLFIGKLKPCLSIDFGSSNTRVIIDKKIVWHQPTLLAWDNHHQHLVAIGDRAASLRGKTPKCIQLIPPVQRGVPAQLDSAKFYLKAVVDQLRTAKVLNQWLPVSCRLAVPASSSPLELEQFRESLNQAGIKVEQLISKTRAIVVLEELAQIDQIHGVIDLGAQTTDVGIFVGQDLIKAVTLTTIGGDDFTRVVIEQVLAEYELVIGWAMAEQIKHQLGSVMALATDRAGVMTVRGKHAKSHLVTAVRIRSSSFQAKFAQLVKVLVDGLMEAINELPAEVVIQLQEQGFYLTGGNSQLRGWPVVLQEALGMPFIMSKSPQIDLVKGLTSVK